MNNVTPYEILIAEKVEQLPIPDMADLIWANIEEQLDADLPDDGDVDVSDKPGPRTGLPGTGKGFIVFAVVAAVVTSVFIFKGNRKKNNPALPPPSTQPINPPAQPQNDSALRRSTKTTDFSSPTQGPDPVVQDNTQTPVVNDVQLPIDSNTAVITAPPFMDTLQKSNTVVLQPDTVSKTTKKPRGVPGINNDDYRISGRDSSNKKKN